MYKQRGTVYLMGTVSTPMTISKVRVRGFPSETVLYLL